MRHASLALLLALSACGGPTGSTCPSDSKLTYGTFGKPFFEKYCTRCHAAGVADRNGAPKDFNFDTLDGIKAHLADIDSEAAAGPNRVNTSMPDGDPKPSEDERRQLGEWLACGAK